MCKCTTQRYSEYTLNIAELGDTLPSVSEEESYAPFTTDIHPHTSTFIGTHSSEADQSESQSIFTDTDESVEVAADVVLSTGLDSDCVAVDDIRDAEERRIARFMTEGCKC